MGNQFAVWDAVRRSGDTMTGNLNLADNRLIFDNGVLDVMVRLYAAGAGALYMRSKDDTTDRDLRAAGAYFYQSIGLANGKTVDGVDISTLSKIHAKRVSYLGDGNDNRNIEMGVDLDTATFAFVMTKARTAVKPCWRAKHQVGDVSKMFDATADPADCIQAFTATGFQVGTNAYVNQDAVNYDAWALWVE